MAVKNAPAPVARLTPISDPVRMSAILRAIEAFDPLQSEGWSDLDALSSQTHVEGVDAHPAAVFQGPDGASFEAIGNIYVTLNYGKGDDASSMGESYPIHVFGRIEGDNAVSIERMSVDTSSFYE